MTLAHRVVYYTSEELVWVCDSLRTRESRSKIIDIFNYGNNDISGNHPTTIHQAKVDPSAWHDIVAEYTQRELTYEKDIFPALSGLGHFFAERISSNYLAGLWDETLTMDLLWRRKHCTTESRRPVAWRAPTWSWASVVGPIYWSVNTILGYRWFAKARATVQPSGVDGFGELKSGTLWLTAPSIRVKLCSEGGLAGGTNEFETRLLRQDREPLYFEDNPGVIGNFYPDYQCGVGWGDVVGDASVRLVILCDWVSGDKRMVQSLVLLCVDEEKQLYERIGWSYMSFQIDKGEEAARREAFKGLVEKTFTVV
jgi:hypothetical protein